MLRMLSLSKDIQYHRQFSTYIANRKDIQYHRQFSTYIANRQI